MCVVVAMHILIISADIILLYSEEVIHHIFPDIAKLIPPINHSKWQGKFQMLFNLNVLELGNEVCLHLL